MSVLVVLRCPTCKKPFLVPWFSLWFRSSLVHVSQHLTYCSVGPGITLLTLPCPCNLVGFGGTICRCVMQLNYVRSNYFHLPLVLDQNAKSKCASTSITNVQGNGVEIICSLEKKSEEILFLTSWVLQNISPLTPSRRSCAGSAFWCCFQSVYQVLGIYQRRRGLSLAEQSHAMVPGVHSSTAYAHTEDADPAVCSHHTETFSCWKGLHHLFSYL